MCAVIDADTQPINQFSTQPSSEQGDDEADEAANICQRRSAYRIRPAKIEAGKKRDDDHNIPQSVHQAHALCASAVRNSDPVHQAEYGCKQARHDSSADHVKSNVGPDGILGSKTDDVEYDGHSEQTEREGDKLLV